MSSVKKTPFLAELKQIFGSSYFVTTVSTYLSNIYACNEIVVSKLTNGVCPSCVKNLDAPSEIVSLKLSRHGFNFCLTFIFWSKSVIGIFPVVPPSTICSLLHKLCSKVKKIKNTLFVQKHQPEQLIGHYLITFGSKPL